MQSYNSFWVFSSKKKKKKLKVIELEIYFERITGIKAALK